VLPENLPDYAWIYAPDAARGLLHLLDIKARPHRVFNICSGQNWGSVITEWATRLQQHHPRFSWRQSAIDAEVTIRLSETLDRGRMDIARITDTSWQPQFGPSRAYADYADWLGHHPDAL
jgi:nucleoside-diphosphate-sugar epimerase